MPNNASMAVREAAVPEVTKRLNAAEREWILGAGARLLKLSSLQARVLASSLEEGSFILDRLSTAFDASRQAIYGVVMALRRRGLLEVTSTVREGPYTRRGVVAGVALRALLKTVEQPAAPGTVGTPSRR